MAYVSHQIRSGTKDMWEFHNPVLDLKEIAFEVLDTGIGTGSINIKQGDGVHTWTELPYAFYFPDSLTDEKVKTISRDVNDNANIYIAGTHNTDEHIGIEYIDTGVYIGAERGELNSLSNVTKKITVNPEDNIGINITTVNTLQKGISINAEFSTGLYIDNKSTNTHNATLDVSGYGLFIDNNSTAGLGIHNHGTGSGISLANYTTGTGEYINNVSTGKGIHVSNSLTGYGIYLENGSSGYGEYIYNTSTGQGLHINNTGVGYGIVVDNYTSNGKCGIAVNNTTNSSVGISVANAGTGYGHKITNNSTGYGIVLYNNSNNVGQYIGNSQGGMGLAIYGNSTGYNLYSEGINYIKNLTTQTINNYVPTEIIASNICWDIKAWNDNIYHNTYDIPSAGAVATYCNSWNAGRRITLQDQSGLNFKDGSNLIEANANGMHIGSNFGAMHLQSSNGFYFHKTDWVSESDPFFNIYLASNGQGGPGEIVTNLSIKAQAFNPYSLVDLKRNINPLNKSGLDLVNSTDVYDYEFKSQDEDNNYKSIGFVIGKGYKLSDELLANDKQAINLYSSVAIAYKAIQELTEENNILKERLNRLEQLLIK